MKKKKSFSETKIRCGYYYGDCIDPKPILSQANLLNLNNKQIAELAKVDVRRVYDWKSSKRKISRYAADNLCTALEIPMSLLYDD